MDWHIWRALLWIRMFDALFQGLTRLTRFTRYSKVWHVWRACVFLSKRKKIFRKVSILTLYVPNEKTEPWNCWSPMTSFDAKFNSHEHLIIFRLPFNCLVSHALFRVARFEEICFTNRATGCFLAAFLVLKANSGRSIPISLRKTWEFVVIASRYFHRCSSAPL